MFAMDAGSTEGHDRHVQFCMSQVEFAHLLYLAAQEGFTFRVSPDGSVEVSGPQQTVTFINPRYKLIAYHDVE